MCRAYARIDLHLSELTCGCTGPAGLSPGSPLSPLTPNDSAAAPSAFTGAAAGSGFGSPPSPGLRRHSGAAPAAPNDAAAPPLLSVLPGSRAAIAAAVPPSPPAAASTGSVPPSSARSPATQPNGVDAAAAAGSSAGQGGSGGRDVQWRGRRVCSRAAPLRQFAPVAALCCAAAPGPAAALLSAGQDGCLRQFGLPAPPVCFCGLHLFCRCCLPMKQPACELVLRHLRLEAVM